MTLVGAFLTELWVLVSTLHFAFAVWVTGHVLLTKRQVAAAVGWTGLAWLVPYGGAALYWLFGINRVQRRAGRLRRGIRYGSRDPGLAHFGADPAAPGAGAGAGGLQLLQPDAAHNLVALSTLAGRLADQPLTAGNAIEPLQGGDTAYPAMLAAIGAAREQVWLASYIMDDDPVGLAFAEALGEAAARGVVVRVLLDALGARYSRRSMARELERRGVTVAHFMPVGWPWRMPYLNLRNHRKILVVDGGTGFTGGMNIRAGCLAAAAPSQRIEDLHFRLAGPVVGHLAETFAADWQFTTGEDLQPLPAPAAPAGPAIARGFSDGPDEPEPRIRWLILGALAEAQQRVRIVTPYFIPDQALVTALGVAALRGLEVDILLPARGNLRLVQWAAWARLADVVACGCRVWLTPAPFDHSKLMTVDGTWSMFGSANWDARSLRLNFELNVEAYDRDLTGRLDALVDRRIAAARPVSLAELRSRSLVLRLRDGVCWLASPYL